jgi:acyl-CoA thioester hydrolase
VVQATVRYKAPARYDEELIVRIRVSSAKLAILKFKYEILRASDEVLLCEGETVHMVVGRDMKRRSLPQKYFELFGDLALRMASA